MSKNTFIPTTKGLVSATKSQDFSSGEKAQATTNIGAVALAGSYSDPAWITALAASKITGTFMKSQQHAQTAFYDQAGTFTQAQNIGTLNLASGAISSPSSLTIAAGNAWNDGSSIQLLNANTVVFEAKATGVTSNVPLIVGAAATLNGPLTINKTGSNGLIVNNTVGNALSVFNASAASVTDNAYLTIQTAGSDRWYVGQSVSALTGNFEIYGTGFGGSMLTLNRTTGAMTANAATFNGNITLPNVGSIRNASGAKLVVGPDGTSPMYLLNSSNGALGLKVGSLVVSSSYGYEAPTYGLYVEGAATVLGFINIGSTDCRMFRDSGNLYLESDGTIILRDTSTGVSNWGLANDGRTFSKTNVWHTDSDGNPRILYNGSGGATNFYGAYDFVSSDRGHGMYSDGIIKWGSSQTVGNSRGILTWDTDKAIVSAPLNMDITCGSTLTIIAPTQTLFTGPVKVSSTGTPVTSVLSATATLDFPSIATNDTHTLTITVTGAAAGDSVCLGIPAGLDSGLIFCASVTAADTVTIRMHNSTGGSIDPASATFRATVIKF